MESYVKWWLILVSVYASFVLGGAVLVSALTLPVGWSMLVGGILGLSGFYVGMAVADRMTAND